MRQLSEYNVYIFDCDGVILDSNSLKIKAMENSLMSLSFSDAEVSECVSYFAKNFGKSRFHHIEYFIENILSIDCQRKREVKIKILESYSSQCKELYLTADLTPGILDFMRGLDGDKYVASGSEQSELREVFDKRGLTSFFRGIYGSPELKSNLVKYILENYETHQAIMFGDAVSDVVAAQDNNIDFIGYLPFSNVKKEMENKANKLGFRLIHNWVNQ